jgi:hypothetical protein
MVPQRIYALSNILVRDESTAGKEKEGAALLPATHQSGTRHIEPTEALRSE